MAANDLPFRSWFPQHRETMIKASSSCEQEMQGFLHLNTSGCPDDYEWSDLETCTVKVLIDCLLDNLSESTKASMASGAVLLGLLPATLALLGSTTLELGILYLKRPLLAFLLSIGSPSISPIRTFTYDDPRDLLSTPPRANSFPRLSTSAALCLSAIQYFVALAAAGNVCHVVAWVGYRAVSSIASEINFMPPFWVAGSLLVYTLGLITVRICLQLRPVDDGKDQQHGRFWLLRLKRACLQEWIPCGRQPRLALRYAPETYTFTAMSWLTSTLTVIHIIFGTVVFSGVLFTGANDAVFIGLRISASTLLARTVLMFELHGIRSRLVPCADEKLESTMSERHASRGFLEGDEVVYTRQQQNKAGLEKTHRVSRNPVPSLPSREPPEQDPGDLRWCQR